MLRLLWVVAALSLSLSLSVTYGQETGEPAKPEVADDAGPIEREEFKLPVQIIEDAAAERIRQEREAAELLLQERDLAAQEGMNAATQSIMTATWLMTILSGIALFATIGSLFILWKTLKEAQQATSKTQDILDNERLALELEYRPLVSIEGLNFRPPLDDLPDPIFFLCEFVLKNTGRTPARVVSQEIFRCYKRVNRLEPGEAARILEGRVSQADNGWTGFLTSAPRVSVGTSILLRELEIRRRPGPDGRPFASDIFFDFNFAVVACRIRYQFGIGDDKRVFEATAGYFVRPILREDGSLESFAYEIAPDFWNAT